MDKPVVKMNVGGEAPPAAGPSPSDDELVGRCRQGCLESFEQLVARYQDRVFNLVYRLTGHHQDTQDIVQDVFLRAFEHIASFRQQAGVYTWLFRIAVNLAISRRRRGRKLRFVPLDGHGGNDDGEAGDGGSADRLADSRTDSPEVAAGRAEQSERLARAIGQLDEEFRSVLVLKDVEGFGYGQIAEVLQLPLGTVKSRLHRARVELRNQLSPAIEMLDES